MLFRHPAFFADVSHAFRLNAFYPSKAFSMPSILKRPINRAGAFLILVTVVAALSLAYMLWPKSLYGMYEATYPHLENDERFSGYVRIEEDRLSGDGLVVTVAHWIITDTHATAYESNGQIAAQFELRESGTLGLATPVGMLLLTPINL